MTTVVAWLALIVSMSSLGWQVLSWAKSGARVHVVCGFSVRTLGTAPVTIAVYVAVTNRGRLGTTVDEAGFRLGSHRAKRFSGFSIDVDKILPLRLEPGDTVVIKRDWAQLEEPIDRFGAWNRDLLHPYARAGGVLRHGKPCKRSVLTRLHHQVETLPPPTEERRLG
ncbi:hypothetical protein [Amycolatopsis speibonae]|uniref:DUF3592 domain-containing protein n=1 Tax=Amycolatopsis speibonae TaxID=1450224 RepID=A0ABV7P1S7_9PSEU